MTVDVQRLTEKARAALVTHFLALSKEDRRLRFGLSLPDETLIAYIHNIDFDHDAVFGVEDDRLDLVGVAHVAFNDEQAELGLSVLPSHRHHGVGSALFERGAVHARNRGMSKLFMHYLRENGAIMHIARRSGMSVVTNIEEADAHLELPPASLVSITGEYVSDKFAVYDHALKLHSAAWKRFNARLGIASIAQGSDLVDAA